MLGQLKFLRDILKYEKANYINLSDIYLQSSQIVAQNKKHTKSSQFFIFELYAWGERFYNIIYQALFTWIYKYIFKLSVSSLSKMFQQEEIIGQEGAILDEQLPLDLQLNFMKNLNISVPEHQKQTTNLNHQKQQDQPTFNLESCNSYVGESGYFIAQNKLFYEECNVFDDKPQEDNQLNITELKFQEQKQENKQEKQPTVRQGVENLQIFCIHKQKTKNGSQTKNIPKNYGKQIIKFIQTHQKLLMPILDRYQISYKDFVKDMKIAKKKMNRIIDLKNLWTEHKYAEPVRIISEHFLRKYSYAWIFNSRIEDIKNPIKYRHRIIEGVHKPQQFNYLKQYS